MNRVDLVGRLTRDPELRHTSSGRAVCQLNLAINRTFTNQNGEREADFINIIVWRKQAENVCNFLDKGSQVAIEGRIQTGSYTDKDGNNRTSFEVVADNVQFLDSKSQRSNESQIPISDGVDIVNDTYSEFGESVSIDDNFLE